MAAGDLCSASPIYSRIRKHSFFTTELTSRLVLSNRYIMRPIGISHTCVKKEKATAGSQLNNIILPDISKYYHFDMYLN